MFEVYLLMLVKCIFHLGVNKSSKCNEIVAYLSRSCKYMEHSFCLLNYDYLFLWLFYTLNDYHNWKKH